MTRPWRLRFAGAKYHVTQRGNGAQAVFLCDGDCQRFLEQLDECLEKDGITLYAYCLMPNHYHLFVATPTGNIHRFMQRLNTAYCMYFRYTSITGRDTAGRAGTGRNWSKGTTISCD